jgi:hypothetical protein
MIQQIFDEEMMNKSQGTLGVAAQYKKSVGAGIIESKAHRNRALHDQFELILLQFVSMVDMRE